MDYFHKNRAYLFPQMDINRPELYSVGKTANIFYSEKNRVGFEYERGNSRSSDKEFTIVATAFKKTSEWTCFLLW